MSLSVNCQLFFDIEQARKMVGVVETYQNTLATHPGMSIPVAAISALTSVIRASTASTMIELSKEMTAATDALQRATQHSVSVTAGCELFTRFISRTGNEIHELVYTNMFDNNLGLCRVQVATLGTWRALCRQGREVP